MKIGIYGGAFNPVHNGHVRLANYFRAYLGLDKMFFVPTARPPHRIEGELISGQNRTEMLRLALAGKDAFEISDAEFRRDGKSYTYDTLLAFQAAYPQASLYLLIGADQFLHFDSWYKAEEIVKMAAICTAARVDEHQRAELETAKDTMPVFKNATVFIADYPALCISSVSIREKLQENLPVSAYVHPDVENYIKEKGLYHV